MYKPSIFIVFFFVYQGIQFAFADPSPLALLKGVEKVRLAYDPITIEFVIDYFDDEDYGTISISNKVEVQGDDRRFERYPAQGSVSFNGSVVIKKGADVYSYDRGNHRDVRLYDMTEARRRADVVYDPRLLGLSDMLIPDATFGRYLCYEHSSDFVLVGKTKIDDSFVWHVRCNQTSGTRDFYVEEPSFNVRRIVYDSKQLKITVESEYNSKHYGPFPSRITVKRFENDNLVFNRTLRITSVETGSSIDLNRFELVSMDLPLNTEVVDYRISRGIGWWDGEKLVDKPVRASAQEMRDWEKGKHRQPLGGAVRYIMMGLGAAMIVYAVVLMIRKRTKNDDGVS